MKTVHLTLGSACWLMGMAFLALSFAGEVDRWDAALLLYLAAQNLAEARES